MSKERPTEKKALIERNELFTWRSSSYSQQQGMVEASGSREIL